MLSGAGAFGASVLGLESPQLAHADDKRSSRREGGHSHDHTKKGYFGVSKLPFHLQHEFSHAISCNNAVAKAVEVQIAAGNKKQHAILQRPGVFGWGTITFFLQLDDSLVGHDMTFFTNVGWSARGGRNTPGKNAGEVVFSVDINGDIVVDGGRSSQGSWAKVQRTLRVNSSEMRVTLMLDSIQGNNDFDFWWGEPQLLAGGAAKQDHDHKHK